MTIFPVVAWKGWSESRAEPNVLHNRPIEQMAERCRCGIFRPLSLFHVARLPATVFHGNRNARTVGPQSYMFSASHQIKRYATVVCHRMQYSQCDVISISKRYASICKKNSKNKNHHFDMPANLHRRHNIYFYWLRESTPTLVRLRIRYAEHKKRCHPLHCSFHQVYICVLHSIFGCDQRLLFVIIVDNKWISVFIGFLMLVLTQHNKGECNLKNIATLSVLNAFVWCLMLDVYLPMAPSAVSRTSIILTSHVGRLHRFTHNIPRVSRVNSCNLSVVSETLTAVKIHHMQKTVK